MGYLTVCVAWELGMPAPLDVLARTNPSVAETLVGDEDEEGGVLLENLRNLTGERIVQTPGDRFWLPTCPTTNTRTGPTAT